MSVIPAPAWGPVERIAVGHTGRWVKLSRIMAEGKVLDGKCNLTRIPENVVLIEDDEIYINNSWYTLYLWDHTRRRFFLEQKGARYAE